MAPGSMLSTGAVLHIGIQLKLICWRKSLLAQVAHLSHSIYMCEEPGIKEILKKISLEKRGDFSQMRKETEATSLGMDLDFQGD